MSARHGGIEAARLVAAFGIIWFHMHAPGAQIAYAALALFVVMTADLAGRAVLEHGAWPVWRARARRLIWPFLVWSAVYLALEAARARSLPDPSALALNPWMVLQGGEFHLWFLPFAAIALLGLQVVPMLVQATGRVGDAVWVLAVVAAGAISAISYALHDQVVMPAPFGSWAFALPAVFLGYLMAAARAAGRPWPAAGFLLLVTVSASALGILNGVLQLLIAAIALTLGWALPLSGAVWPRAGALAFGIYLTHPAVALILFRYAPQTEGTVPGVLIIFFASLALTAALRRVRLLRAIL